MTTPAFDAAIEGADVVVCCGSGGVGKTTTAAALGLELARRGRRVVVVTIDPAKRLADALGLPDGLTNEPARLVLDPAVGGEMWAMMLDTAETFDGLVRANAPSPEQAERILANGFYRNIAGALSGTQEYMAAERLHALHGDSRFDVVIVDTPPTRNALDFLDAPGTLSRFIDHPLFRLMMMPTRRGLRVLNVAAQPVLRTIGKVVGGEVLADAIAFFQAFDGMETGFRRRADDVLEVLHAPTTRYLLVASPKRDTVEEARFFAGRLAESDLRVAGLVVNRCTPFFGTPTCRRSKADAALWENLDELNATAAAEREQLGDLLADVAGAPVAWVPLLPDDVHDLDGLDLIRGLLFERAGAPPAAAAG
ncbi:MAG: ArsA-related P-loop ATPase [Ilumatobacteraceae bacterium]